MVQGWAQEDSKREGSMDGRDVLDSGYIWKVERVRFPDVLDVGLQRGHHGF